MRGRRVAQPLQLGELPRLTSRRERIITRPTEANGTPMRVDREIIEVGYGAKAVSLECSQEGTSAEAFPPANSTTRKGHSTAPSPADKQMVRIAGQSEVGGAGEPSDHSPTKTMKVVTRSSGSAAAITGEPARLAPQVAATSPET